MFRRMMMMMMVVVAAAAMAAGSVAGCGSGEADEPPQDRAVAWAEDICGSVTEIGKKLSQLPKIDAGNPKKAKAGVADYLGMLSTAFDTMSKDLHKAGTPPVEDGKTVYGRAMTTIEEIQTAVDKAKKRLESTKVSDKTGLRKALQRAGKDMSKVRDHAGPTEDLLANPELKTAFSKADGCEQIA